MLCRSYGLLLQLHEPLVQEEVENYSKYSAKFANEWNDYGWCQGTS